MHWAADVHKYIVKINVFCNCVTKSNVKHNDFQIIMTSTSTSKLLKSKQKTTFFQYFYNPWGTSKSDRRKMCLKPGAWKTFIFQRKSNVVEAWSLENLHFPKEKPMILKPGVWKTCIFQRNSNVFEAWGLENLIFQKGSDFF